MRAGREGKADEAAGAPSPGKESKRKYESKKTEESDSGLLWTVVARRYLSTSLTPKYLLGR